MSFGELQLQKWGWKEGKGLGRHENGIADALKPQLKFNTAGLGHDQSEEFTFQWWDHVYNKAASSMSVKKAKGGKIEIIKTEDLKVSTKKSSIKSKAPSYNTYYGNFIKGSVLEGDKIVSEPDDSQSMPLMPQEKSLELIKTFSDNELFQMCGGLTAHKGARHGLTMSAKLARLEQQEQMLLNPHNNDTSTCNSKKKKRKLLEEHNVSKNPLVEVSENSFVNCEKTKSKKKKNKKLEGCKFPENLFVELSENFDGNCEESKSRKKKRKLLEECNLPENCLAEEVPENLSVYGEETKSKKKKKKKLLEESNSLENLAINMCEDVSVDSEKTKFKKKKKKKSKHREEEKELITNDAICETKEDNSKAVVNLDCNELLEIKHKKKKKRKKENYDSDL